MDRNRHSTVSLTLPAITSSGATSGYFTNGNGTSIAPTVPVADWANGITEELYGTITESGQTPSQSDLTQLITAISNIGKRKNRIINGNMDVWQRGITLGSAVNTAYLADRWKSDGVGSTTVISRQPFQSGAYAAISVPNEPDYFHRTVVTSVANIANFASLEQRIEYAKTLQGKQVTLSFWAKADASKSIAISLSQNFGTGGSPSATVNTAIAKQAITTTFTKYSFTFTVPSIVGKTLGTNLNDYLAVKFWFDAGSNFNAQTNTLGQQSGTFDIAQVQLEVGSKATDFEYRNYREEQALSFRYYERGSANTFIVVASGNNAGGLMFRTEKRALPTVVISPTTGTGAGAASSNDGFIQSGFNSVISSCSWTADAEL